MKKVMKKLLKILMWTLIVVLALVLLLPLWFGPVVRTVANVVAPSVLGTGFNLGVLSLNQYNGKFTLGDMQLLNPEDFKEKVAVSVGEIHVNADMTTVASDVIVIEDIRLRDLFVAYVSNDKGENNFAIIQRNVTGEKKSEEPTTEAKEKEAKPDKAEEKPAKTEEKSAPAEEKPAKKVIIDHLLIENVMVQYGVLTLPVPNIELNGIGRDSGGAKWSEVWNNIYTTAMKSLGDAGKMIKNFGSNVSDATMKQVGNMTDAFKGGADIVGESTGKAVDAVSDSAGKAVDAVSDSAGKAVDAIKNLF